MPTTSVSSVAIAITITITITIAIARAIIVPHPSSLPARRRLGERPADEGGVAGLQHGAPRDRSL